MNNLQYFIRFLKEHDILYAFFDAFTEMRIMNEKNAPYQNPIKVIEENYEIDKNFISRSFPWAETKQGHAFWYKTHKIFYHWWSNNAKYRVE